jgi:hypothetical protein
MARLAGRALVAALDELPEKLAAEPGELGPLLSQVGLEEFFGAAVADVLPSDELHGACARSLPDRSELLTAVASAVLARMLQRGDGQVPLSGDERDRIVELLAARLESGYRGIFSRSAGFLGRQAMKVTTQPLAQFLRGPATERAVPPLGDILHYQAHGEGLRNYLAEHIRQSDEDVVVLAHSLGGVAAVDLLASRPMPQVRLLVTVGSQAGFLHELGALAGLKPGVRELPSYMPDWLNIFDRRDFLAYLAAPVFNGGPTGLSRVRDFEVYSRQPFPLSHSAYWKLDGVYAEICALIA